MPTRAPGPQAHQAEVDEEMRGKARIGTWGPQGPMYPQSHSTWACVMSICENSSSFRNFKHRPKLSLTLMRTSSPRSPQDGLAPSLTPPSRAQRKLPGFQKPQPWRMQPLEVGPKHWVSPRNPYDTSVTLARPGLGQRAWQLQ